MMNSILSFFFDSSIVASNKRIYTQKILLLLLFFVGVSILYYNFSYFYLTICLISIFLFNNVGMDAGTHRYFSHRSFKVNNFFNFFLALFSCLSSLGTIRDQVGMHRLHHKYEDTVYDPQSQEYVNWWYLYTNNFPFISTRREFVSLTKDISNNDLITFFDNNYFKIIYCYIFVLLLIDPLLIWFVYIIPAGFVLHTLGLSNIISHKFGYTNFASNNKSKNSVFGFILGLGANGWHNNHHKYPYKWNHGFKWWEIDPTSWFIRIIKVKNGN